MSPSYQSWLPGSASSTGRFSAHGNADRNGPIVRSSYADAVAAGYTSSPPKTSSSPRGSGPSTPSIDSAG